MTSSAIPLQDLAQRISQQQTELQKLRQEYEARQAQLQELAHRKKQLQDQLRQIDAQILGIGQGKTLPVSKPSVRATAPAKRRKKLGRTISLPQLLIDIVSKAGRPVTVKELAHEVVRRKYHTTS